MVAGEKPALCITEPEAGSAATDMTTTAVRDGDDSVITGQKRGITGASISKTLLIFSRVHEGAQDDGIGGILVESTTPGIELGKRWPMRGLRGLPECEVYLRGCRVGAGNLRVREDGCRKLMSASNGHHLGAAPVALGIAEGRQIWRCATPRNAGSSAVRSRRSRACSGCSPTWD